MARIQHILQRFDVAEASMCLVLNRSSEAFPIRQLFRIV